MKKEQSPKARILEMEKLYIAAQDIPAQQEKLLKELQKNEKILCRLGEYCRDHWIEDHDYEKEHPIPLSESSTGILSEDGLFNLLGGQHDRAVKLLDLARKILKSY